VTGLDVATATSRLAAEGLVVTTADGDPATRPEEAGRVQSQVPAPGAEVATGTRVTVRVRGAWVDPRRTVPDVRGLGLALARQRLEEQGLRVSWTEGSAATRPEEANTVASQEPAPGQRVAAGTTVSLRMHGAYADPDPIVTGDPFYVVTHAGVPKVDIDVSGDRKAQQILAEVDATRVEWFPTEEAVLLLRVEGEALAMLPREKFTVGARFALPVTYEWVGRETGHRRTVEGAILQQVVGTATTLEEVLRRFPAVAEEYGEPGDAPTISRRDGTFHHTFSEQEDDLWDEAYEGSLRGGPIAWGWSPASKQATLDLARGLAREFDCFLATAVYRAAWGPALDTFRRFRDEVLLESEEGRRLVALYYRIGPALANRLRRAPSARAALRPLFDVLAVALRSTDLEDPRTREVFDHLIRTLASFLLPEGELGLPPDFLHHFHPCTPGSPLHRFLHPPTTEVSTWKR